MITIINYGLGNIQAFANIYKRLNIPARIASTVQDLAEAEKIILPGVGAFDWAMTLLNESGMRGRLEELVIGRGCPVLGICVGMQIMAKRSDEGVLDGLGWIDAEVRRFSKESGVVSKESGVRSKELGVVSKEIGVRSEELGVMRKVFLPHMGWNDVVPCNTDCLFKNLGADARFYFLHSYYFLPKRQEQVLAVTDYNGRYASAVRSGNVFGVQFHPEKSHHWGIQLLKNFAEL